MTDFSPSFYAVIPATVRYCKNLEMGARLLYGEITALCSKEGYCWATNKYFADLYGIKIRMIQYWIQSLKNEGFIIVESSENKSGRVIRLKESLPMQKIAGGDAKNCMHSNTSISTGSLVCFKSKNSSGKISIEKQELVQKLRQKGYSPAEIQEGIEAALEEKEKQKSLYVSNIVSYVKQIIENKRKEKENEQRRSDYKPRSRRKQDSKFGEISKHTSSSIDWKPEEGPNSRRSDGHDYRF